MANLFATRPARSLRAVVALIAALHIIGPVANPVAFAGNALPKAVWLKTGSGVLGSADATFLSRDWAKYYAPGLRFTHAYISAGSAFTLNWKVTGINGKALANYPVTLQMNKAYGGSNAHFTANCVTADGSKPNDDGGRLYSRTNPQGLVSFQITNQDAVGEDASTPTNKIDTNSKIVYGQFALQIGNLGDSDQVNELVEVHVLGKASSIAGSTCTDWVAPASQYVKSVPVTPSKLQVTKPNISGHDLGQLIWSDEFNAKAGQAPQSSVWTSRVCGTSNANGGGIYCNGDQYYLPSANRTDGKGNLVITSTRSEGAQTLGQDCQASNCPFATGRFDSQGKLALRYGYLEVRAQMPQGVGQNPAFWLLGDNITRVGWPTSGEIDVLEQPLIAVTQNAGSLHYSTTFGGCCDNRRSFTVTKAAAESLANNFHTYAINWSPGYIEIYLDGIMYGSLSKADAGTKFWPFDSPAFLIFDNATPGNKSAMTWQQSQFLIDYVRLWKSDGRGSAWTH
ncbi:MAG: family 16 glycosylhydrolase [Micrococcales bacterium]